MSPERQTQGLTPTDPNNTLEPILVEAVGGPGGPARVLLTAGTLVVGSHEDCGLCVQDPAVSRHHASLELLRGEVLVRDLGSRNGTRYLRARIQQARVPLGGVIEIGKTQLHLRPPRAPVLESQATQLEGLLGVSHAMREVFAQLEQLGPSEVPVVLQGETGTGKELAAHALHRLSPRTSGPFVVFDCASAGESLAEGHLFGHVAGAFTGAVRDHAGAVTRAEGGTLFLDSIHELPMSVQPLLLRLLSEHEYKRVGGTRTEQANFRVIASCQSSLEARVKSGQFREDLYYRLATGTVRLPSLRERPEDIPMLARHFAHELGQVEVVLRAETIHSLQCALWLGNVRELKTAVERVARLGFWEESEGKEAPALSLQEMTSRLERDYVTALLARHQGNISAVAREAGLARSQLYRILERHGLKSS